MDLESSQYDPGIIVILPKWTNKATILSGMLALIILGLSLELIKANEHSRQLQEEIATMSQGKNVPLVVCAHDIPAGTVIGPEMLTTKIVKEENLQSDAIRDRDLVIGRTTLEPLKKGEYLGSYSMGFRFFDWQGTNSIEQSKAFGRFVGISLPDKRILNVDGHKLEITNAWIENPSNTHVLVRDPNNECLCFTINIDGKRPQHCNQIKLEFRYAGKLKIVEKTREYQTNPGTYYIKYPIMHAEDVIPVKVSIKKEHSLSGKTETTNLGITFTRPKGAIRDQI